MIFSVALLSIVLMYVFCYLDRERPKYPIQEEPDTPINGVRAVGEASGTVKVVRDKRSEETVQVR